MRFAVPILEATEVGPLAEAGAAEFYCGYQDAAWTARFGDHDSASRRQGRANLSDPGALRELAAEARKNDRPISLALNGRVSAGQLDDCRRLAELWCQCGGTGIILRDPALLTLLRKEFPLRYTASLLAVTVNAAGAQLWRELGADRIVLPRFLSPEEMGAVAAGTPGPEYEAMVMGDRCLFIDGFCRSIHAVGRQRAVPGTEPQDVRYTWNPTGSSFHLCGEFCTPASDPCAACALAELESCGVTVGKLGGRGLPLETRLRWLRFLQLAEREKSAPVIRAAYRERFGHACCCYYPDAKPDRKTAATKGESTDHCSPEAAPTVLGHHGCPRALREIVETLPSFSDGQSSALRLVIPPLMPGLFADFEEILTRISQRERTELVLNDYGALYCAAARKRGGALKAELTLGVLLSGQETDPVLTDLTQPQDGGVFWESDGCVELRWSPPPEALQAHWRCPSALHQAGLLRSLGVTGVELGPQALEPPLELAGLRVRRLDSAVVSVFPCRGDCAHCGGQTVQRAGKRLYSDRNLLLWSSGPRPGKAAGNAG